jgi:hypothetical protein
MSKRRYLDRTQRVLELQRPRPSEALENDPTGLVEALADLLLEAMGLGGLRRMGGADEQQDHT